MTPEQRSKLQETLRGGQPSARSRSRKPDSLTKVYAIASGKGGVGKSSVTVNLGIAMAKQGMKVGIVDADIYGHSVPAMLGIADTRPTQVEDLIMPVPTAERRLGDQHRHAQAEARPGRRLARPDARPGARADARRRLLGRPRRAAARPAPRHRRRRDLAGPAPAERGDHRRHHPPGGSRRGRRAGRHDGLDDAPARHRRRREHVVPALPALRRQGVEHRLEIFGSGGGARVAATLGGRFGYDVPLLGQVPIDPHLREGGDAGKPIVESDPTAPGAVVLEKVARALTGRGRGLAGMQLGLSPTAKG